MILVNDIKEAAAEILATRFYSKYVVLDFEHIGIGEDGEKMKHAIDTLNLTFFYCRVQKMYNNIGFNEVIDYSILYDVMDHVLMEKPFNDAQLIKYYQLKEKYTAVIDSMNSLLNEDDYYLDYDVDFILLGLTRDELKACKNADSDFEAEFHDKFSRTMFKYTRGEITVDLIKALKKVMKEAKEKAAALENIKK